MTDTATTLPAPYAAPIPYTTVHPVDDVMHARAILLRVSTSNIAAWGTRQRNPGEPPRSYVLLASGQAFDVDEDLADLDAAMGYTGP